MTKSKLNQALMEEKQDIAPIDETDVMAEAGRKIFAEQLHKMLSHDEGSRTGDDIESVHQMRVATRRMRSAFRLMGSYYKKKTVKKYNSKLRLIARTLGEVRDLDVLIEDLNYYRLEQSDADRLILDSIIHLVDKRRIRRRIELNAFLDSKPYYRFVKKFSKFTKKAGAGAIPIDEPEHPHQVRHILPVLLHERLSRVRAYDVVIDEADDEVLHALRVEFKQLRYALEFFKPVLGISATRFIDEVKAVQDILGRMNDIVVFAKTVNSLKRIAPEQEQLIANYIESRYLELDQLRNHFYTKWQAFNLRTTQRQFADALLVLH